MAEELLLVAIGCSRLPGMLKIASRHTFVVFGTMDGEVWADLADPYTGDSPRALPVYFYESG